MTVETFLKLLTQHNTLIIQVLVTVILLLSCYIIYRVYVAGSPDEESGQSQHLEKTLQKFLELQASQGIKTDGGKTEGASSEAGSDLEKLREEVIKSRAMIKEKDEKIAALEAQIAGGAGAAAPADGLNGEEKAKLEAKITDLEQRLAEYEIIAEDIADLARYRDENIKLKDELQKLSGGAGAVSSPAAPAPAPAPAVSTTAPEATAPEATAPEATAPEATAPVAPSTQVESPNDSAPIEAVASSPIATEANPPNPEAAVSSAPRDDANAISASDPTKISEGTSATAANPAGNVAPAEPASGVSAAETVSDDIMAEFEAAVLQQKAAASGATPAASTEGNVPGAEVPEADRAKLLSDFENFVKKS